MSSASLMHSSLSMPSLSFRPSVHDSDRGSVSPPSSPYASLSSYNSAAELLDYPYAVHTTHTHRPSYSSTSSSSPSSSPYSLSTDESTSDFDSSHWRSSAELSHTWHNATSTQQNDNCAEDNKDFLAGAVLQLERHAPRLPSPPPPTSSRSGSSSASSVSSGSSSSSSNLTPTAATDPSAVTASQTTHKRKRTALTLNADERLQRRRAQHRAVDANRRQKENEAITRLHKLIKQQQQQVNDVDELTAEGSVDDDDAEAASRREKAGRLTVLESSIALIEQLTTACKRMEAACNAKDAQVSSVSSRLHSVAAVIAQQASSLAFVDSVDGFTASSLEFAQPWQSASLMSNGSTQPHFLPNLQSHLQTAAAPPLLTSASSFLSVLPPTTSSYLVHSDLTSTLRQSTTSLLHTMAMTVIVLPSKLVIDVNERFLTMAGYRRSEVMYRSLDAVSMNANVRQYPASLAALEAVMAGTKLQGTAVWRCRWGDGRLRENSCTFFAIYDEPSVGGGAVVGGVSGGGGERRGMPDKMLIVSAPEESILIDEPQITS